MGIRISNLPPIVAPNYLKYELMVQIIFFLLRHPMLKLDLWFYAYI